MILCTAFKVDKDMMLFFVGIIKTLMNWYKINRGCDMRAHSNLSAIVIKHSVGDISVDYITYTKLLFIAIKIPGNTLMLINIY